MLIRIYEKDLINLAGYVWAALREIRRHWRRTAGEERSYHRAAHAVANERYFARACTGRGCLCAERVNRVRELHGVFIHRALAFARVVAITWRAGRRIGDRIEWKTTPCGRATMIIGAVIYVAQRFHIVWIVLQRERLEERRERPLTGVGGLVRVVEICVHLRREVSGVFVRAMDEDDRMNVVGVVQPMHDKARGIQRARRLARL